jgi:hypothetical protein
MLGKRTLCAPDKQRQADRGHILLNRRFDDLLGTAADAGVYHFEAGVSQHVGDVLGTTVMTIEAGLSDEDALVRDLGRHVRPVDCPPRTRYNASLGRVICDIWMDYASRYYHCRTGKASRRSRPWV